MEFYIYRTTNILDGKIYIGVHKISGKEKTEYLGSGKYLKSAIKKYGRNNFVKEILCYCDDYDEAYMVEEWLVDDDFVKNENTYNCKHGGKGGRGLIYSDELRSIRSNRISGEQNPMYGTKRIEDQNPFFGKTHSESTKRIIGEKNRLALTGKPKKNKENYGKYFIGKKFYNNGTRNFRLSEDDNKIIELNLIKGRI